MIANIKKKVNNLRLRRAFRVLTALLKKTKTQMTTQSAMDFLFSREGSLITPWQFQSELKGFLTIYEELKPKCAMEIGTANGGTLFCHCRLAAADATIISVDLPGGKFGGGYPDWKTPVYSEFALPGQNLHLVRASSHDAATVEKVRTILNGKQLDYLFIDGDHTYAGVKKDFELYSPFVRQGGVVVFHDVVPHQGSSCKVDEFWNEIKQQHRHQEFIDRPDQQHYGVGVLFLK